MHVELGIEPLDIVKSLPVVGIPPRLDLSTPVGNQEATSENQAVLELDPTVQPSPLHVR